MNKMKFFVSAFRLLLSMLVLSIVLWSCDKDSDVTPGKSEPAIEEIVPQEGMDLYGLITDDSGMPVPNVVVSDGFACVLTDAEGVYQMKKNVNSKFVFYSTPSDYEVNTLSENVKMASFYSAISGVERHDFKLKKLASIEDKFKLLCIGDPQTYNIEGINRFKDETMADIKAFVSAEQLPCYGLALGDIVSDQPGFFEQMRSLMGSTSMSVFATIGNHDKVIGASQMVPRNAEAYSKTFGPLNYSFNRGDVHFVCLDNIIFKNSSDFSIGFTDEQIKWLKQDLSFVPKTKMVIVYYHIPIRGSSSIVNRDQFFEAIQDYAEVHLMSGHTHYTENYIHSSHNNIYEHVHAAACGSWWRSTLNGDGTPNGYAVYSVDGASLTEWFYKPVKLDANFQMRLHQGDKWFGGQYAYYTFDQGENTVVVNVWNADSEWKVEAYEDGVKVADLLPLSSSSRDAWTLGYHIGVINRNPVNYSPPCKHLYLHHLNNPQAKLEIKVTDRFGNTYVEDKITSGYETAMSYE